MKYLLLLLFIVLSFEVKAKETLNFFWGLHLHQEDLDESNITLAADQVTLEKSEMDAILIGGFTNTIQQKDAKFLIQMTITKPQVKKKNSDYRVVLEIKKFEGEIPNKVASSSFFISVLKNLKKHILTSRLGNSKDQISFIVSSQEKL